VIFSEAGSFGGHRFPWSLSALVGVAVVFLLASTAARAAIILADTGAGDGVLACVSEQCAYTPATENPAKAFNGAVESAMNQNGSFIRFAFTVSGGTGSTGTSPTAAGALLITILGSASEPVGTPVSLQLNTFVTPDPGPDVTIINFLNNTEYDVNTGPVINGLRVGDSFGYWAYVSVLSNTSYIYQVDLTVQGTELTTIREPGILALLMTASLALAVIVLCRGTKREKFFPAPLQE